jgi:predicted AAA+ superfamily ATPase
VPTITQWLGVLETTAQALLVPPYFENLGKRLVKSARPYFVDSGLTCFLLGIDSAAELERSPFLGPLFEGFVAAEIAKAQAAVGLQRQLYHFRDQYGLEVDFVVPLSGDRLALLEAKSSTTLRPHFADALVRLAALVKKRKVESYLVHRSAPGAPAYVAIRPGVRALPVGALPALFERRGRRKFAGAVG